MFYSFTVATRLARRQVGSFRRTAWSGLCLHTPMPEPGSPGVPEPIPPLPSDDIEPIEDPPGDGAEPTPPVQDPPRAPNSDVPERLDRVPAATAVLPLSGRRPVPFRARVRASAARSGFPFQMQYRCLQNCPRTPV